MKVFLRILVIIVIVGALGGTGYFLWQKDQEKPVTFETEQAFHTDIIRKTVATGSIVPRQEIEIKPAISGIIESIMVEPGQIIKKGDLVARIKVIPDMVSLNNAEARVEQAQIRFDEAKIDYDRTKPLYEQGVVPLADYQRSDISFRTAKQEVEAAESNLQIIRDGITAKAGQPTNTLIRSTVEGMVLDVPVEEGKSVIESNTFNDGTTIALIADMGSLVFEGQVDESEVGKIEEGMDLLLSIGAIKDQTFHARLEYIAPKGIEDAGTIQFEIKAAVELKDSVFIRAGYSANADIVLERKDSVMAIGERLLQFSNDSTFVEVETDKQQFEKRYVKTGLSDGINIEIKDGVTLDDKIKVPKAF